MPTHSLLIKSNQNLAFEKAFVFAQTAIKKSDKIKQVFLLGDAVQRYHQCDWLSLNVPVRLCIDSAIKNNIFNAKLAQEYDKKITLLPGYEISSLTQFFDCLMACDYSREFA